MFIRKLALSSELISLKEAHSSEINDLKLDSEEKLKTLMESLTDKDEELTAVREEASKTFSDSQEYRNLINQLKEKDDAIAKRNEELKKTFQQLQVLDSKKNPAAGTVIID